MSPLDVEYQSTSASATQVPGAGRIQSLQSLSSADYQDRPASLHRDIRPKPLSPPGNSGSPPGSSNSNSSNKYGKQKKSILSRAIGTKEPSLDALEQLRQRTFAEAKDAYDAAIKLNVSPMKLPPEAPSPASKEPEPPRKRKGGNEKKRENSQENLAKIQRFGSSDTFGKEATRSPMLTLRSAQRASSVLTQQNSIDENTPYLSSESQATTAIPSSVGSTGGEPVSLTEVLGIEEARDSLEYSSSEDSVEFSIRDSFILTPSPLTPRGGTARKVSPISQIVEDDISSPSALSQDIDEMIPSASPPLRAPPSPPSAKNVSQPATLHLQQTIKPDLRHEWTAHNTQQSIQQKGKCKNNSFKMASFFHVFRKKSELHE
jgi:hypothetical protein